MNAFEHSLRNAQRNIPSLVAWTPFSDHKHARLILEKSTNLISAQIPHLRDFSPNATAVVLRPKAHAFLLDSLRNQFLCLVRRLGVYRDHFSLDVIKNGICHIADKVLCVLARDSSSSSP